LIEQRLYHLQAARETRLAVSKTEDEGERTATELSAVGLRTRVWPAAAAWCSRGMAFLPLTLPLPLTLGAGALAWYSSLALAP
jgi:hypothetical protein